MRDRVRELLNAGDAWGALMEALREAGARPTLDPRRSTALPCELCGTTAEPRQLVQIGTYTRRMGGGLQPGDAITRPLCAACVALTA